MLDEFQPLRLWYFWKIMDQILIKSPSTKFASLWPELQINKKVLYEFQPLRPWYLWKIMDQILIKSPPTKFASLWPELAYASPFLSLGAEFGIYFVWSEDNSFHG